MAKPTSSSAFVLGFAVLTSSLALVAACSDDAGKLTGRGTPPAVTGDGGASSSSSSGGAAAAAAEAQFRGLQAELDKTCGNICHKAGAATPPPPTFLADPDPYISIKAYRGIVVPDPYASRMVTRGAHDGPALKDTPELEKKVFEWLKAEAVAIVADKAPTTDAVAIVNGPNDIDLTKACSTGITGVHLKFTASLVGTSLALTDVKVAVPAGSDVHMAHPKAIKILKAPKADGSDEEVDPADSFSIVDVQLPNGAETPLTNVTFTGSTWRPWDFATDKIRFEFDKLEPGKVKEAGGATGCKDVAGFVANVLPTMRGAGTTPNPCSNCHSNANAIANLNLTNPDNAFVCSTVLAKMNKANLAQSSIITKVSGNGVTHGGGQVANPAAWAKLFTDNQGVFF